MMSRKRRSFTLNNNPGGVDREPTLALMIAACVVPLAVALWVGFLFVLAWSAWREGDSAASWGAVAWLIGEGLFWVGCAGALGYACVCEIRRRWRTRRRAG